VQAFFIDHQTGRLRSIGRAPTGGQGACHVSVTPCGRWVLVAHYQSGSVAALPVGNDGAPRPPTRVIEHRGSSVHPTRQTRSHAHSITPDRSGAFAIVADLGLDEIVVYPRDEQNGLGPDRVAHVSVAPGAGPRHVAWHPDGGHLYAVHELSGSVSVMDYRAQDGILSERQVVASVQPWTEECSGAEIVMHPGGRFLYTSIRGNDSIAVFAVAPDRSLRLVGVESTTGRTPRHFAIAPDGRHIIVAHQDSDDVVVFAIDTDTGLLRGTANRVHVPTPVCIRLPEPPPHRGA
jgi:6-phosphogluconolactonase